MGLIVGIDLGTTFSSVAVLDKFGKPDILANREGERLTPSVVLFDNDTPLVGQLALNQARHSPLDCVQFVKRYMGDKSWKYVSDSDEIYTPEDISALILKKLKEDAEAALNTNITDAVITVPAYFNDTQRKATKDAGTIAGLNVVKMINEPTAAALAYGITKSSESQTVLVYDLGGGTFDVTIMKLSEGHLDVITTGGDRHLGGFDFDNALMDLIAEEFKKETKVDLRDDETLAQDLRDKAEIAKKTLSTRGSTNVFLTANGANVTVPVTLEQFNSVTEHLIKRTSTIMEFALEDAHLSWHDIDKILLVGGSTRMKAVIESVKRISGKTPSQDIHPDEAVVKGAALQGGIMSLERGDTDVEGTEAISLVEINDVTSHSLGVIAVDEQEREFNSIILAKDTVYPCKVSKEYCTVVDNQTKLLVKVTQGEDESPEYVEVLGTSEMTIPPYKKGAPVEVFFEYDISANVHVSVYDLTANRMLGTVEIKDQGRLTNTEIREKQERAGKLRIG